MKKILIIKHGSFGDIILSLYPIYSIKKHYNNSSLTILTESRYYDLFKVVPFIDNIKFDNRPRLLNLINLIKLCIWFYKEKFDWVFDLQTSNRTNIYFYIFSLFSKFKWNGIAKKCSHPHLDRKRTSLHTLDRQKEQLKIAGIKGKNKLNWEFLKSDITKFCLNNNLFLLVIGGSLHRPEKRWPVEKYIELIKYLNYKKICPIIIGGNSEKKYLLSENWKKVKFTSLVGKTSYLDLAEISRKSKWIVGNDTGPMHLLVQCSDPSTKKIVLFGSHSNPKLCAPIGKNVFILQKKIIDDILPSDVIKLLD